MHASHRKSFVGLFFGLGSVRALRALTEPNPKNNGPQNFFMKCLVTGPNILTPLAGNLTFPSIIGLSRINESKDTVQGYSTVKKWN